MKNFLFIYRSHKNKPEQRSKILEAIDNNYCNHDFGFFLLSLKCVANVDFIFGVEELDNYLERSTRYASLRKNCLPQMQARTKRI